MTEIQSSGGGLKIFLREREDMSASNTGVSWWMISTPPASILIPIAAVTRMQGGWQVANPNLGYVAMLMLVTVFGIVAGRCTR